MRTVVRPRRAKPICLGLRVDEDLRRIFKDSAKHAGQTCQEYFESLLASAQKHERAGHAALLVPIELIDHVELLCVLHSKTKRHPELLHGVQVSLKGLVRVLKEMENI